MSEKLSSEDSIVILRKEDLVEIYRVSVAAEQNELRTELSIDLTVSTADLA